MNLVIVESPAKAKTINKYLGSDYTVLASYGHIRDLPSKNGSVDPENSFKMIWEVDSFSKKYLKEITDTVKNSEKIILFFWLTDPWGFLNMLYRPIVKMTITAHIARFLKFIIIN